MPAMPDIWAAVDFRPLAAAQSESASPQLRGLFRRRNSENLVIARASSPPDTLVRARARAYKLQLCEYNIRRFRVRNGRRLDHPPLDYSSSIPRSVLMKLPAAAIPPRDYYYYYCSIAISSRRNRAYVGTQRAWPSPMLGLRACRSERKLFRARRGYLAR